MKYYFKWFLFPTENKTHKTELLTLSGSAAYERLTSATKQTTKNESIHHETLLPSRVLELIFNQQEPGVSFRCYFSKRNLTGCLVRGKYCHFDRLCVGGPAHSPLDTLARETHFTETTPKLQEGRPTSQILEEKNCCFSKSPNDIITITLSHLK